MIPPDDTLDTLLAALLDAPRDTVLVQVIADRLEETGHPAAAWWWKEIAQLTERYYHRPQTTWGTYLDGTVERTHPGITDLCQRLDRLAAARQLLAAGTARVE